MLLHAEVFVRNQNFTSRSTTLQGGTNIFSVYFKNGSTLYGECNCDDPYTEYYIPIVSNFRTLRRYPVTNQVLHGVEAVAGLESLELWANSVNLRISYGGITEEHMHEKYIRRGLCR